MQQCASGQVFTVSFINIYIYNLHCEAVLFCITADPGHCQNNGVYINLIVYVVVRTVFMI